MGWALTVAAMPSLTPPHHPFQMPEGHQNEDHAGFAFDLEADRTRPDKVTMPGMCLSFSYHNHYFKGWFTGHLLGLGLGTTNVPQQ